MLLAGDSRFPVSQCLPPIERSLLGEPSCGWGGAGRGVRTQGWGQVALGADILES